MLVGRNARGGGETQRSGGGSESSCLSCGGLGGALGFPLTSGPAHHPYARPQCLSVFLSPRPPLNYRITVFSARSIGGAGSSILFICCYWFLWFTQPNKLNRPDE